ncbi:SDR family NAD(P)-dependent oxidoreductase [Pseudomonas zeshuii]|nr:SDR family NAD(P)-dependent oxidoreductase [Pseudomonas zeshuii]QEU27091.1 SDR family NAD(P)-dependent oxidoreductase [Pseudomonas luteola]
MNVLIVGASRGIGLALVTQYLERGAQVFALVRRSDNEALQQLSATYGDRLVLLSGDMTDPALIPSLKKQLQNTTLDRLIVNAGIYGPDHQDVMAINTEEIAELFSTNTIAPLRIVEGLSHCIADGGVVACMSSQMGSVTLDRAADMPLYGASKAALNSLLRPVPRTFMHRPVACGSPRVGRVRVVPPAQAGCAPHQSVPQNASRVAAHSLSSRAERTWPVGRTH